MACLTGSHLAELVRKLLAAVGGAVRLRGVLLHSLLQGGEGGSVHADGGLEEQGGRKGDERGEMWTSPWR